MELPLGRVEGFYRRSVDGKEYISFEGIPYAAPPVGNNRFKASRALNNLIVIKCEVTYNYNSRLNRLVMYSH